MGTAVGYGPRARDWLSCSRSFCSNPPTRTWPILFEFTCLWPGKNVYVKTDLSPGLSAACLWCGWGRSFKLLCSLWTKTLKGSSGSTRPEKSLLRLSAFFLLPSYFFIRLLNSWIVEKQLFKKRFSLFLWGFWMSGRKICDWDLLVPSTELYHFSFRLWQGFWNVMETQHRFSEKAIATQSLFFLCPISRQIFLYTC